MPKVGTLYVVILFHELGHVLMSQRLGGEADRIILWPFGGLAFTKQHSNDPWERIKVLLAGPITHIPIAAVAFLVWWVSAEASVFRWWFWFVATLNVRLFCFNMFVPAYPLDGCCILATWLQIFYTADTTARVFVQFCSIPPSLYFLSAAIFFLGMVVFFWWGFSSVLGSPSNGIVIRSRTGVCDGTLS